MRAVDPLANLRSMATVYDHEPKQRQCATMLRCMAQPSSLPEEREGDVRLQSAAELAAEPSVLTPTRVRWLLRPRSMFDHETRRSFCRPPPEVAGISFVHGSPVNAPRLAAFGNLGSDRPAQRFSFAPPASLSARLWWPRIGTQHAGRLHQFLRAATVPVPGEQQADQHHLVTLSLRRAYELRELAAGKAPHASNAQVAARELPLVVQRGSAGSDVEWAMQRQNHALADTHRDAYSDDGSPPLGSTWTCATGRAQVCQGRITFLAVLTERAFAGVACPHHVGDFAAIAAAQKRRDALRLAPRDVSDRDAHPRPDSPPCRESAEPIGEPRGLARQLPTLLSTPVAVAQGAPSPPSARMCIQANAALSAAHAPIGGQGRNLDARLRHGVADGEVAGAVKAAERKAHAVGELQLFS